MATAKSVKRFNGDRDPEPSFPVRPKHAYLEQTMSGIAEQTAKELERERTVELREKMETPATGQKDEIVKIESSVTTVLGEDVADIELYAIKTGHRTYPSHRLYIDRQRLIYSTVNATKASFFVDISATDEDPLQGFWVEKYRLINLNGHTRDVIVEIGADEYKQLVFEQNEETMDGLIVDQVPVHALAKLIVARGVGSDALAPKPKWESFGEFKTRTEKGGK